jgi:RNA polymerase sigma-70 factor (ECF subfamily)
MRALESHIGNKQQPDGQGREHYAGELEDVVVRPPPMLYRRDHRYGGDQHDAEDAVQDAVLSATEHLDQFKGTAQMTTRLTTIVTNCALSQLHKKPRHLHVSLDEPVNEEQDYFASGRLADARPSPESECIRSELYGKLMRSVEGLSPALRKAIKLCNLDGLTTREAAGVLGLAQGTVKAQVSRARTRLKRFVSNA